MQPADQASTSYFFPAVFFRRSAQRFFIISDNRFRPAALKWPRFLVRMLPRDCVPLGAPVGDRPSRDAMARSIRILSAFNSETIAAMFNFPPVWIIVFGTRLLPVGGFSRLETGLSLPET
jgi:hypothetical protein